MGIDLAALANDHSITAFTYRGQDGKVTYRPSELTTENVERFSDPDSTDSGPFMEWLVGTIVDWDILNGGQKLPITIAGMKKLPFSLLKKISEAMVNDQGDISPEADSSSDAG